MPEQLYLSDHAVAARYGIIYDACVLYPAPLRDLLLELATAELFQARWTDMIHEEWIENLLVNRPDLDRGRVYRTRDLMNTSVMDCLVAGYEHLIETITLPDPNDRHVVAAAIHAHADAIVTFNLKDFQADVLAAYNLEAIHPDDFIKYQLDLNTASVLAATRECRSRLQNPPKTVEAYLEKLREQSLPKSVDVLYEYAAVI